MAEINQNDAALMKAALEVLDELTEKTVDLYRGADGASLAALKQSAGKQMTSAEMAGVMHMLLFLSDDALCARMKEAVDRYVSAE